MHGLAVTAIVAVLASLVAIADGTKQRSGEVASEQQSLRFCATAQGLAVEAPEAMEKLMRRGSFRQTVGDLLARVRLRCWSDFFFFFFFFPQRDWSNPPRTARLSLLVFVAVAASASCTYPDCLILPVGAGDRRRSDCGSNGGRGGTGWNDCRSFRCRPYRPGLEYAAASLVFLFNDGLHRYPSVCLCLADLKFPESAKRLALLRVAKVELEMVRADGISGPVAWTSRLAAARSEIGDQPDKAGLQRLFVCQALARGRTPEILHAVWSGDAGAFSLAEFLSLRSGIAHVDPVAVCVYHLVDGLTEIDSIEAHGEIAGGIAKGGSLRDTRLMDDLVRVGGGRVHVIEVEAAAVDGDPETAGLRALFLKGGLLMRLGIAFVAPAAPLLNDDVAGSFRLLFFVVLCGTGAVDLRGLQWPRLGQFACKPYSEEMSLFAFTRICFAYASQA